MDDFVKAVQAKIDEYIRIMGERWDNALYGDKNEQEINKYMERVRQAMMPDSD